MAKVFVNGWTDERTAAEKECAAYYKDEVELCPDLNTPEDYAEVEARNKKREEEKKKGENGN